MQLIPSYSFKSKMKFSAFILCLMVAGSYAFIGERCDVSRCKESVRGLGDSLVMPKANQLPEYCPKILEFLDCSLEAVQSCSGKSLDELVASGNQSVAEEVTIFVEIRSLVRDLCDPDSSLHKVYVENIECFRGFANVASRLCSMEARETLGNFFDESNIKEDGLDEVLSSEIRCLEMGYEVTCFSIHLGESCGEESRSAFVNGIRRFRSAFGLKCGGGTQNLKTKFYNYLEIDDEEISKLKETFDLFRRRR